MDKWRSRGDNVRSTGGVGKGGGGAERSRVRVDMSETSSMRRRLREIGRAGLRRGWRGAGSDKFRGGVRGQAQGQSEELILRQDEKGRQ
jgi:hypothetical protein